MSAVLVCSCGQNGGSTSEEAAVVEEKVPVVKVHEAQLEVVSHEDVYSTTVQAFVVNNIAPQGTGRIVKINVEIGDFVEKGQILAEMDNSNLEQAQLRLKNAEDELERVKSLLSEGGISQSDFDQIELSFKVAKSGYENLLENTILRSPISGVVTSRNYDQSDMYSMSQPIFTVQQITPVKMLVAVSESDYTKVKKGDRITISADALPGKTFTGTIARIYPTMDSSTHTFNVEVQVRNEKRELRPGMYARAVVNFGDVENVVLPDKAVLKMQGAGTRYVYYLKEDGTVNTKVVTTGKHFDSKYEILSGLKGGEKIVLEGQSALRAGIKVEVVK